MIAVIADDFTGAAEIGGIGLRHGLNVVIETGEMLTTKADLLIIATDTRSLSPKDGASEMAHVTKMVTKIKPDFIFKKLDSVLRGNITDELTAQMNILGIKRSLVIAGNPVFNRIIKNGEYFIGDIPLNKTCFSSDPHYPVKSSSVLKLLNKGENLNVVSIKSTQKIPDSGIAVGDAISFEDLDKWANSIDDKTLIAGASGFFNAILESKKIADKTKKYDFVPFGDKALFILGSTFPKEIDFLQKFEENGHYLSNMPKEIYFNKDCDESYFNFWVDDIVQGINNQHKVVASINHSSCGESDIASRIKEIIGKLTRDVLKKVKLDELLIEGGSTTSVVLKYLGIKNLEPFQEISPGVIRMKIKEFPNMCLTTKPGSYFWPTNIIIPDDIKHTNNISID